MTTDGAADPGVTSPPADHRTVSSQAAIYLVGTVGAAGIQFVAIPIFTRTLGPAAFGELGLVVTVTSMLVSLMGLGSDMVLARFWFESPDFASRRRLASQWITLMMLWSVVVAMVASGLVLMGSRVLDTPPSLPAALVVGIVALLPQLLATMLAQVLRNEFRPWPFSITSVTQAFFRALFGITLVVVFHVGVVGVLLGMLLADLAIVLVRLSLVQLSWTFRVDVKAMRPLLRFGLPFVPGALAFWAYNGLDRLVLAGHVDVETLGAYVAATALVAPITIVMTAVAQAWLPFITDTYMKSSHRAASMIRSGFEGAVLTYGGLSVVIGYLAAPLIIVIAGPEFEAGAAAIPLLALGHVFWGVSLFAASGSTLAKKSGFIPVISVISVAAEFITLLLLVPRFGIVGAAGSVAIGYFLMASAFLLYSQATFPVPLSWWAVTAEVLALVGAALALSLSPKSPGLNALILAILLIFALRILWLLRRTQALRE